MKRLIVVVSLFAISLGWLMRQYRHWIITQTERVSAESKIIQTHLSQIEYDLRGEGPVVLHFHGGNVGHNGWFMLEHLVQAGFQLLTPDRPGYLGTPQTGNGSPERQADLFTALLDKLDIDKVAVVGVSAGGPPALQFALRHPQRVTAVVLLSAITQQTKLAEDQLNSTLGKLVMTPRFQNVAYLLINLAMKRLPSLALQDYVRTETTYDMETGKQLIAQILANPSQKQQVMALADGIVPALPRFEGVMNDLEVQQTLVDLPLKKIQAPTLIVHSRHDGDVPYTNATQAHEQIPNSELITVDQFGHMIWWGDQEVTQDFHARIEAFLHTHVAD